MKRTLVHEMSPVPQPSDICASLEGQPFRIFFDSAAPVGKYARYSFVAADPVTTITAKGNRAEIRRRGEPVRNAEPAGAALQLLREILDENKSESVIGLPPFQGGAAGYIGYEFGCALEGVGAPPIDDLEVPDFCVGIYDTVFAWDHQENRAWLLSQSRDRLAFFLDLSRNKLSGTKPLARRSSPAVSSSMSRGEYREAIAAIKEYIAAGDIFQANFAQRFCSRLEAKPWDLYKTVRGLNPAPFGCFFEVGNLSILSVSPERFIKVDSDRTAETRPIKGTRPRKSDVTDDAESRSALIDSEKDNAEHVMIVDVLRNDLSRVCKPGSVRVTALAAAEAHPTVHHLVSTITGQLRDDADSIDLLRASLPGGSITGAPKIRATEIIAELEPVRRDVYCGCMLYLTSQGIMDSSIVIRTFLAKDDKVYFSAGGGIVADSDATLEFEETLHKASALFAALGAND